MKKPDIKVMNAWVVEAKEAAEDWRKDSWRSCEAVDGKILTDEEEDDMIDKGITPLDINRIFPVVNLLTGSEAINKYDSIAKGRTNKDIETARTMSEAVQFVYDQNDVEFKKSQAFFDEVVPGVGYLSVGINPDPRRERIQIKHQPWTTIWSDPFAGPWLETENCRYVFNHPWKNLNDICAMFPDKERDIRDLYKEYTGEPKSGNLFNDEATKIEDMQLGSSDWADKSTQRIRPVGMWYTVLEPCIFGVFADGRAIEVKENLQPNQQYQILSQAQEIVKATVRKMRVCTFLGELELQDKPTHLPHDDFPYIPFVGYTDRFNFPYGVPRQIIGQNVEVIKRRSLALEMLKKRRLYIEEGALADSSPSGIEDAYDEVNKLDGLVVLKNGAIVKGQLKIDDNQQLAHGQMTMHEHSEREIQQISGANDVTLGYDTRAQSGKAMEIEKNQGSMITASLFDNYRRSQKRLGEQTCSLIQGEWTGPKILRVTDNMTGSEKFVQINEQVETDTGIEVRNDVTQGKYDVVVTEAPATDTIREKNMNLLIEWVKKSPPEFAPYLLSMAMEMSNMPNKDVLLAKIKPLLGEQPGQEDLSAEEIKQQQLDQAQATAEAEQKMKEFEDEKIRLELEHQQLENDKLRAEIENIRSGTVNDKETADVDNFGKGFGIGKEMAGATA